MQCRRVEYMPVQCSAGVRMGVRCSAGVSIGDASVCMCVAMQAERGKLCVGRQLGGSELATSHSDRMRAVHLGGGALEKKMKVL